MLGRYDAMPPSVSAAERAALQALIEANCPRRPTPAEHMQALPREVQVGPHSISIELMSPEKVRGSGSYGEFSASEMKVYLEASPVSISLAVDTLLHELLHAIYWTYHVDSRDDEERTVKTIATGLTALFQDNPSLLEWLRRARA